MAMLAEDIEAFSRHRFACCPQGFDSEHGQACYSVWQRSVLQKFNFNRCNGLIDEERFIGMVGETRQVPFAVIFREGCCGFIDGFHSLEVGWHHVENGSLGASQVEQCVSVFPFTVATEGGDQQRWSGRYSHD